MRINNFSKLIILLITTTLVSGCEGFGVSSQNPSSSNADTSQSDSSSSSSQSSNSSSSSSSQTQQDPVIPPSYGDNPILKDYTLQSNPNTCENHSLKEEIVWKASIVSKGVKRFKCENCGGFTEEYYYDLSEVAFESKTFACDGKERTLYIEGMLPYDVSVKYTNNKRTEAGSQEAKAEFFDQDNQKIGEKTATLTIDDEINGFPNVKITTATGQDPDRKEKVVYTSMTTTVDNCDEEWALEDEAGGIRIRGNSTKQEGVNKLAWRLKFNNKVNMLGLHGGKKYKSWVVLADNFDYSYFRNMTAFNYGNSLFNYTNNYCSDYQHINLYMNGEYRGIYLLAEQQQSNSGRFSIEESEGDESTNVGYLLEIDGLVLQGKSDGDYTFTTNSSSLNGTSISSKGYVVKTDVFGDQQGPFIKKYVRNLQEVFINACKGNKLQVLNSAGDIVDSPYATQYETLNSIFDLDSFFRMYVLQEFMKNFDCGWGSFYLYIDFSSKTKHPRFTTGGPWDFDLGLGNKKRDGKYQSTGDFITNVKNSMTEFNPWLYILSQTEFFTELFERYYQAFAKSDIYEQAIHDIEYETSAFATDFANEYTKWGSDSGRSKMSTRSYSSHADAVSYLKTWLTERKAYLDGKYIK